MTRETRDPAHIAEYDQLKARSLSELKMLRDQLQHDIDLGHDELCAMGRYYNESCQAFEDIGAECIPMLIRLLGFAMLDSVTVPDQIGCER